MGMGTLRGGRFNLLLSVRHNASSARLDQWHDSFQRASELLFDATDGQQQLGDVYVVNDSHGGRNADAWLMEADGRSNAGGLAALGTETTHMTLWGDERFKPFVVLHELIHYLHGPADEYSGPDGAATCVGGSSSEACIMEGGWWEGDRFGDDATGGALVTGRYSELCTSDNHDTDTDTWQHDRWGEDCWQTVVDEYPALTAPAGAPTATAPTGAGAINWIELVGEERFVLVVDASGSMSGTKLQEAKFGADWWADQALTGERLGVVSYATTAPSPPDYPLTTISGDAERAAAQAAVAGISAGGRTAIGDGLRRALEELVGAGERASTQVVVLLTDGLHNQGEDPAAVLPDLIDNGVRVYTIGVGPTIDATLLQRIADDTGGTFTRINPSLSTTDQEFAIRTALQEISGVSRDGGGVITTFPERIAPGAGGEREARGVYVERGSELATFAVSWPSPKDRIVMRVTSPGGAVIGPGQVPSGVRELISSGPAGDMRPWHGYQVQDPEPGTWRVETLPRRVDRAIDAQVFAFSRNRHIDASLDVRRVNGRGDRVPILFRAYHDVPLLGVSLDAHVVTPSGVRIALERFDAVEDPSRCDVGTLATSFDHTKERGVYRVEVVLRSDEGTARPATGGERLRSGESDTPEMGIPTFTRQYSASFRVGEEVSRRIDIDPDRADRGQRLSVTVRGQNTRFEAGGTFVTFGSDIRVVNQHVVDSETLRALIVVPKEASGRRNVRVTTPRWAEQLELEDALTIGRADAPAPLLHGVIDGLIFDRRSRLIAARVGDQVVRAPASAEGVLRRAQDSGNAVRLDLDEDGVIDRVELR